MQFISFDPFTVWVTRTYTFREFTMTTRIAFQHPTMRLVLEMRHGYASGP